MHDELILPYFDMVIGIIGFVSDEVASLGYRYSSFG
jgi:hypothetical protein